MKKRNILVVTFAIAAGSMLPMKANAQQHLHYFTHTHYNSLAHEHARPSRFETYPSYSSIPGSGYGGSYGSSYAFGNGYSSYGYSNTCGCYMPYIDGGVGLNGYGYYGYGSNYGYSYRSGGNY